MISFVFHFQVFVMGIKIRLFVSVCIARLLGKRGGTTHAYCLFPFYAPILTRPLLYGNSGCAVLGLGTQN